MLRFEQTALGDDEMVYLSTSNHRAGDLSLDGVPVIEGPPDVFVALRDEKGATLGTGETLKVGVLVRSHPNRRPTPRAADAV